MLYKDLSCKYIGTKHRASEQTTLHFAVLKLMVYLMVLIVFCLLLYLYCFQTSFRVIYVKFCTKCETTTQMKCSFNIYVTFKITKLVSTSGITGGPPSLGMFSSYKTLNFVQLLLKTFLSKFNYSLIIDRLTLCTIALRSFVFGTCALFSVSVLQ